MTSTELNATLGIETETATVAQMVKRAAEFSDEMADCYEAGSLEANAFEALAIILNALEKTVGG